MQETYVKLHPDYSPTTVWGFDGQVPGPLFQAKYGEPILVRFHNHLPSVKIPQAFGIAEMTTHLHNAPHPVGERRQPGQLLQLDQRSQRHQSARVQGPALSERLGRLHRPGQHRSAIRREALSSLWYHDHHLDFTAQNVYKGMFGCYNLFDDKDTGDETTGLRLPSGKYDIPIFFNDFLFDQNCQQVFDLFDLDGILGDRFCANGAIQPFLNVDKRRYRFRLYNPGPSRWYEFALYDGTNFIPFWQISSDGNLLPQAIQVSSVRLAVAERVDIIVDFSKIKASRLYLVNRLEQVNGRGPTGKILTPGTPIVQINIGATAPDLQRRSRGAAAGCLHARPARSRLQRLAGTRREGQDPHLAVRTRQRRLAGQRQVLRRERGQCRHPAGIRRGLGHPEPRRRLATSGPHPLRGAPRAVAQRRAGQAERQVNGSIDYARKDVIELNTNEEVRIFMRFRDMKGRYVMHCHNVVHEDHAMMIRWDIV